MLRKVFIIFLITLFQTVTKAQPVNLFVNDTAVNCQNFFELPVRVSGFKEILSTQFTLNWDTSKISFLSISNIDTSILKLSLSNFGQNNISKGSLTFSWNDVTVLGKSLPDSSILFNLRFNTKKAVPSFSEIAFSNSPTSIEVINKSLSSLPVIINNATVNLLCDQSSPVKLFIPDLIDSCNSFIELPLKVSGFENLTSLQFSLSWDTTVLRFISIVNPVQNDLSLNNSNFGLTKTGIGSLSFSWFDPLLTGKSLQDSSNLFRIKFLIKQAQLSKTIVNIDSFPTIIEAIDNNLVDRQVVTSSSDIVILCYDKTNLILSADNIQDTCGKNIQIPIRVNGFKNILSLQHSLQWDTTYLRFSNISNLSNSDLSLTLSNFGLTNTSKGILSFSWNDPNLNGKSLIDSSILYSINFLLKTKDTLPTFLTFVNNPTVIEAINSAYEKENVLLNNGEIRISCTDCFFIDSISAQVCSNELPFSFLGYTFTSAGQVVDTVRGVGGSCDTVRTIRLTVSPSPLVKFNINDSLQCITSNRFEFINQSTIQNGVLTYLWKLGDGTFRNSTNISYSYSNSGTYNVLLLATTERGCSDSLQKILKVSPQLPNEKYDTVFAPVGIETQLFSRKLENAKYKWLPNQFLNQDDIYNPIFKGDTSQLYIIRITDISECIVNDTLNVICNLKADIIVPKAFSPNNDRINDELKPLLVNIKKLNYFRVYNRWGVKIYDSANDNLNKWDGRFKSVNQPVDTYVWVASGVDILGNVVTKTGNFILLR